MQLETLRDVHEALLGMGGPRRHLSGYRAYPDDFTKMALIIKEYLDQDSKEHPVLDQSSPN